MCKSCTGGEFAPMTLIAVSEEKATAFARHLTEAGGGARNGSGGEVYDNPSAQGVTVTIPFLGNPDFAFAVRREALSTGSATEDETWAMIDRAYADAIGVPVEEARRQRLEHDGNIVEPNSADEPFGSMPEELEDLLRSLGILPV